MGKQISLGIGEHMHKSSHLLGEKHQRVERAATNANSANFNDRRIWREMNVWARRLVEEGGLKGGLRKDRRMLNVAECGHEHKVRSAAFGIELLADKRVELVEHL